jgi:dipeptidyl aminopeptidase/acylaminoacyl peptidase
MTPVTIKAQDGLTLVGYLTLPWGATAPLIMSPHGGPSIAIRG